MVFGSKICTCNMYCVSAVGPKRKQETNKQTNKQITTTTSKLLIKPQLSVDKRPTVRRLSSVTRLLADGSVRSAENDLHSTDRFVSVLFFNSLKVTPDLSRMSSRVLLEKLSMRAILKESTANYISLESLINVDFGKKNTNSQFFKFHKRKLHWWPQKWPCAIQSNKWINRVPKFGRFLWNLAWTFLRCCETKVWRGFLKFIFHPWRSSMQCPSRILCCSNLTD